MILNLYASKDIYKSGTKPNGDPTYNCFYGYNKITIDSTDTTQLQQLPYLSLTTFMLRAITPAMDKPLHAKGLTNCMNSINHAHGGYRDQAHTIGLTDTAVFDIDQTDTTLEQFSGILADNNIASVTYPSFSHRHLGGKATKYRVLVNRPLTATITGIYSSKIKTDAKATLMHDGRTITVNALLISDLLGREHQLMDRLLPTGETDKAMAVVPQMVKQSALASDEAVAIFTTEGGPLWRSITLV